MTRELSIEADIADLGGKISVVVEVTRANGTLNFEFDYAEVIDSGEYVSPEELEPYNEELCRLADDEFYRNYS